MVHDVDVTHLGVPMSGYGSGCGFGTGFGTGFVGGILGGAQR